MLNSISRECQVKVIRKTIRQGVVLSVSNNKAGPSYSRERLDFQGFNAHPWRTFRFTKASKLGSYDVILMKLKNVTYTYTDLLTQSPASSRVAFATKNNYQDLGLVIFWFDQLCPDTDTDTDNCNVWASHLRLRDIVIGLYFHTVIIH